MNGQNESASGFFWEKQKATGQSESNKDAYFKDKPAKLRSAEEMNALVEERRAKAFAARTPRDILKKSAPQPFNFDEATPPISRFAYAFSQATGIDHSGMIVAATTAAASIIDD